MQRYRDRHDAGRTLAELVAGAVPADERPIVLGLPRGGVPVAAHVAERVGGDLDVLTVRKIGTPGHRELAIGAVASGGLAVFNHQLIDQLGLTRRAIDGATAQARAELEAQEQRFGAGDRSLELADRAVVVVDDGLATGATMQAAVRAVRTAAPSRIIGAVPVGAPDSCALVAALTDAFVCPLQPVSFSAVGQWYVDFSATTDDDVLALLRRE